MIRANVSRKHYFDQLSVRFELVVEQMTDRFELIVKQMTNRFKLIVEQMTDRFRTKYVLVNHSISLLCTSQLKVDSKDKYQN